MRRCAPWILALAMSAAVPSTAPGQQLADGLALEAVVPLPLTDLPVAFAFLPDGRILLLELQAATVRVSVPGSGTAVDLHTVPDVETAGAEQGLQGIAVDPAWPTRPYLYLYYNHVGGVNHLTMYTVSGELSDPSSTALALSDPYHLLTDIPDVRAWHNGGTARFGPDGMLYLSLGDDGAACDAQDPGVLAGSILRLDVSGMPGGGSGPPAKAAITPADNPFAGPDDNTRLTYAWGLRNPFRFTVDPATGDLFVGDVGFLSHEEVDRITPADAGPCEAANRCTPILGRPMINDPRPQDRRPSRPTKEKPRG